MNEADNPSEVRSGENTPNSLAHELETIIEAQGDQPNPPTTEQSKRLEELVATENPPDTTEIIATLLAAREAQLPELNEALAVLRSKRIAGDHQYRNNSESARTYDHVLVGLMEQGYDDVASELISSSVSEEENLDFTISFALPDDAVRATALQAHARELIAAKRTKLEAALAANGTPAGLATRLIENATDPDAAGAVSPEDWAAFPAADATARGILTETHDGIPRVVSSINQITKHGLAADAEMLVRHLVKLPDSEAEETYLSSYAKAKQIIAEEYTAAMPYDVPNMLSMLAKFASPADGLAAIQELYGDKFTVTDAMSFGELCKDELGRDESLECGVEYLGSLKLLKQALDEVDASEFHHLEGFSRKLKGDEHPMIKAEQMVKSIAAARALIEKNPNMIFDLPYSHDLEHLADALAKVGPVAVEQSAESRDQLVKAVIESDDALTATDRLLEILPIVRGKGMDFGDIGPNMLLAKTQGADGDLTPEQTRQIVERLCSEKLIMSEGEAANLTLYQQMIENNRPRTDKVSLAELPEVAARLAKLGLDPDVAESVYSSLSSFSALHKYVYKNPGKTMRSLDKYELANLATTQSDHLLDGINALQTYADEFGADELNGVIGTFGIHLFERYIPAKLHDQYAAWQSGERPTQNIVVTARADWNSALENTGREQNKQLDEGTTFFFEVADSTELAKVMVAVGNRERAHGRNPETDEFVENVIINAHASASGLLLGPEDQHLNVADYIDAESGRAKLESTNGRTATINNYRRHLGGKFRVILQACSTAGDNGADKNIAESISLGHGARVAGSPFTISGSYVINPDGDVSFIAETDKQVTPARIYNSR